MGHTSTQLPHSIHLAGSMTALFEIIRIASPSQTLRHLAQPLHWLESTERTGCPGELLHPLVKNSRLSIIKMLVKLFRIIA